MKTNIQTLSKPSNGESNSIFSEAVYRQEQAIHASLLVVVVLLLIGTISVLTSCQSPVDIDTPRVTKADVVWQNSGGLTAVRTLQGKEPDVKIQVERMIGTTNGNTFVTATFGGSFTSAVRLGEKRDPFFGYFVGGMNIGGREFLIMTTANRQLITNLWGTTSVSVWDKFSSTVSLNDLNLSDNNIRIPEARRIIGVDESTVIKVSDNLMLQLDKPAEEGTETEILFYSNAYFVQPVIKSIAVGAKNTTITNTDLKDYMNRYTSTTNNNPSSQYPMFFLAVRVKTANSVNDGKVSLAGVTTVSYRLRAE